MWVHSVCDRVQAIFAQCSWAQGGTLGEGPVRGQHLSDDPCVSLATQHIL